MGLPIYHSQYTAAQIEASIGKLPRIKSSTRTWEVWDISSSSYVDTGVSIDTELLIDDSLTEAGYAADAKVVGDKITTVQSSSLINTAPHAGSIAVWEENRSFATTTGASYTPTSSEQIYNKRLRSNPLPQRIAAIRSASEGYEFAVYAWDRAQYSPNSAGGSTAGYLGQWNGTEWEKANLKWHTMVDLKETPGYENNLFRVVVKKVVDYVEQVVTEDDADGVFLIEATDATGKMPKVAADAQKSGEHFTLMRRNLFNVERFANTANALFGVILGGISDINGKYYNDDTSCRTYAILCNTPNTARDQYYILDIPGYEWMCWVYNVDPYIITPSTPGIRCLTSGFVSSDEPILYTHESEDTCVKFAFRRKDSATMTDDLTDQESDAYKIQHALHLYVAYDFKAQDELLKRESEYSFLPMSDIPLNALAYHAQYDDLVSDGSLVRTYLAKSNNDASLPIYLYSLQNDKSKLKTDYSYSEWTGGPEMYVRPRIMITSGMHGNERSTPQALYSFIRNLCSDPRYQQLRNAFDWFFIPLVCPWGFSHTGLKGNGTEAKGDNLLDIVSVIENTSEFHQGIRRLPGGTLGTAGEDPNRQFSTRTSTYAENAAVKFALVSLTGIGELTPEEAALVSPDPIPASAGATTGTTRKFTFFMDAHQASAEQGAASSGIPQPFAPAISCFMSLGYYTPAEIKNSVFGKFCQAGAIIENLLDAKYGLPHVQSVYPWGGDDGIASNADVLRNFAQDYADICACFEGTQTAHYYSGSTVWNNPYTRDIVNTSLQTVLRVLCQRWL